MMSREFEDDLSRPLERLGFGPAGFISDHRTRVASAINRAKYPPPLSYTLPMIHLHHPSTRNA